MKPCAWYHKAAMYLLLVLCAVSVFLSACLFSTKINKSILTVIDEKRRKLPSHFLLPVCGSAEYMSWSAAVLMRKLFLYFCSAWHFTQRKDNLIPRVCSWRKDIFQKLLFIFKHHYLVDLFVFNFLRKWSVGKSLSKKILKILSISSPFCFQHWIE